MRDLLRHLTDALDAGREAILCQVVETRGSTPQKAGALMLVDPDGGQVGTLGGGCVEAEVKQKAIRGLGQPGAALHAFLLDHDHAWADGLICGGRMLILTEALRGPAASAYYRAYRDLLDSGSGLTEAIALDPARTGAPAIGHRYLFDAEGRFVASWPGGDPPDEVVARLAPLADRPGPSASGGVAILPVLPRVRLAIVGAGHVGQAVAELAARADFDVWVIDDRRQYAHPDRFPTAQRLIVGPIGEVLPALDVTPHTFALIVTRGHGHDEEALFHLAPTPARYVGLIGSRRKIRLIFQALRDQGLPESALRRVSAPVGLDIGSQTVFEIAVSIVAELIARRNLPPGPSDGSTSSTRSPSEPRGLSDPGPRPRWDPESPPPPDAEENPSPGRA